MIGPIMFAAPDTGMAACITFGGQDTGGIDTARESGYMVITLREDTNLFRVGGLPGCDQATQQTEKSADEHFRKVMAL